jgi:hypothetical protein
MKDYLLQKLFLEILLKRKNKKDKFIIPWLRHSRLAGLLGPKSIHSKYIQSLGPRVNINEASA